ncbi:C-type lectin domain family 5 member A isoform X1 [Sorex araneus]|uniref:C-type lectin domain family 5 member A isoform X1 n=1 Tax=Sorex araneus TaxID=42254 RepID=UPI0003316AED|nr:C-type lectin domain family 5 member A isoform X1 [Sorex araneus]
MNWHLIISGLIVVALKVVGMTFFLLYFPQIFGEGDVHFTPTGSYGTVTEIFGTSNTSVMPTESSGTACPRGWDFYEGSCFFLSSFELPWNKSREFCEAQESTLAIVNTPNKLTFLQNIAGDERYFIGLFYQHAENQWRWINNSIFKGEVSNMNPNFNCVIIGLTSTYDAASCDTKRRWICEKRAK